VGDHVLFDHIAIAVPRLADVPRALVDELGGTAGFGAVAGAFVFARWRFDGGGRLEVLEPRGEDSFLHRFLAQRGPGIHHATFKVPSLREAIRRAEELGHLVVGVDESNPSWKEAFLHPSRALGILVQLAESRSPRGLPPPRREAPARPSSAPPPVRIVGLRTRASSAERARRQWELLLRGACLEGTEGPLVFRWPDSPLRLAVDIDGAGEEGPIAIELRSDRRIATAGKPHPTLGAVLTQLP